MADTRQPFSASAREIDETTTNESTSRSKHPPLSEIEEQRSSVLSFMENSVSVLAKTVRMKSVYDVNNPAPQPKRPLHERNPREFCAIVIGGCLLSFNAGFVNAVTLIISGFTVSHVTGSTTKAAILLYKGSYIAMSKLIVLIGCFIFGSMLSAMLTHHQTFHLGREYNRIFLLGSFFLGLGCVFRVYLPEYQFYALCAAVTCGLQNAMTTRYSNNILRTTHLTGTATDIGIVLGHLTLGNKKDQWKLYLLVPMYISFFLGGLIGAVAEDKMGSEYSLYSSLFLFAGTGLIYMIYLSCVQHIPVLKMYFSDDRLSRGRTDTDPSQNGTHSNLELAPSPGTGYRDVHGEYDSDQSEGIRSESDEDAQVAAVNEKSSIDAKI